MKTPPSIVSVETIDEKGFSGFYEFSEFWTSAQRQANRLHEVSYRACFKPQLPKYFIDRYTEVGDVVYDPFAGRGTTAIESALNGRNVASNDVNPLSVVLTRPRLEVPHLHEISSRLNQIPKTSDGTDDFDLSMFFHPDTLSEILSLRSYLIERQTDGTEDYIDRWLRMVAINRLTGHSPGFFSVYSLPPNQAVSRQRQVQINAKRNQAPTYRDTHDLIWRKSKALSAQLDERACATLRSAASQAVFLSEDAANTPQLSDESVQLIVTSPPFLDVVQYADDNWMRTWFAGIDADAVSKRITMSRTVEDWQEKMGRVFEELSRVTRPGGAIAFEVGEVRNGRVNLEEAVIPIGIESGLSLEKVMINEQRFSKTSNIWGVKNNDAGTNTNRIVVFRKPLT